MIQAGGPPRVLFAYAHPDDESFSSAGTASKLSARGAHVEVLLATRGDAGEINVPELNNADGRRRLPEIRESETRDAVHTFGGRGVTFLRHGDGLLPSIEPEELAHEVALHIADLKPTIIVTFGPDGIYGHPDHVAISSAVGRAWHIAAEGVAGRRHAASRLFWQVLHEDTAASILQERGPVMLGGLPHPFVGYPDSWITTRVDVSAHLETKMQAIAAHRTQTAHILDDMRRRFADRPEELFVLADSRVPDHPELPEDPLAGLW